MKVYPDVTRKQRAKRFGASISSVACFLMAPAAAATPAITGAAAEKMAAASPQRERHRAWTMCVDYVADLVIAQGGDMAKLRSMIPLGCEEEESRLTGSLIARYGYAQGNAAMQALKLSAETRYAARITQRDNPPKQPGVLETTAEGWQVRRLVDGCIAVSIRRNSLNAGGRGIVLQQSAAGAKIDFIVLGSDMGSIDPKMTESFDGPALASDNQRRELVSMTLAPHRIEDGMMFETAATDEIIAQLEWAQTVQIMVPSGGGSEWPTIYRVVGLRTAWTAMQRCAAK